MGKGAGARGKGRGTGFHHVVQHRHSVSSGILQPRRADAAAIESGHQALLLPDPL